MKTPSCALSTKLGGKIINFTKILKVEIFA